MKNRVSDMFLSICIFIIGICLLLWAETVTNLVSQVFGTLLILYGIYQLIIYFRSQDKKVITLIYGIVFLIIGIVLVVRPTIVSEIISFIIGIYIIFMSIKNIGLALEFKDGPNYKLGVGLGIAEIILGVLCVVGKMLIPNIVLRFVGLLLVIYGIINIIDAIIVPRNRNLVVIEHKEES